MQATRGMMETSAATKIGLAYSSYMPDFIAQFQAIIDYVEIPHELITSQPGVLETIGSLPIILHCASLSLAGTVLPSQLIVDDVVESIQSTKTPWLGEHLSFISAEDPFSPGQLYQMGYTASPPLNSQALTLISENVQTFQQNTKIPIIVENPPLYFVPPGSTMNQIEFIQQVCNHTTANLLLDLSHFYITCQTMGWCASKQIQKLPLDRVVEVHISGFQQQGGVYWDDHATLPSTDCLHLLECVIDLCHPKAVTLEYNWPSVIHCEQLQRSLLEIKKIVNQSCR
jgi:uncharacterized protein